MKKHCVICDRSDSDVVGWRIYHDTGFICRVHTMFSEQDCEYSREFDGTNCPYYTVVEDRNVGLRTLMRFMYTRRYYLQFKYHDMSIRELGFSVRAEKALLTAQYYKLSDIYTAGLDKIKNLKNIGNATIKEIETVCCQQSNIELAEPINLPYFAKFIERKEINYYYSSGNAPEY